eukprot:461702-Rhodomonas_salina.1
MLQVPPGSSDVMLTIRIEQTDFDAPDEDIALVLVDGAPVDFSPITFVDFFYYGYELHSGDFFDYSGDVDYADTSMCGTFLTIVDQLS